MSDTPLSSQSLFDQLRKKIRQVGSPLLYAALLMGYAYKRPDTPAWAKRIIMGAFVYLISPLDAIPDMAPIFGYTDDLGVLTYGLVMIAAYINPEVRLAARHTLHDWIGETDDAVLKPVDRLL